MWYAHRYLYIAKGNLYKGCDVLFAYLYLGFMYLGFRYGQAVFILVIRACEDTTHLGGGHFPDTHDEYACSIPHPYATLVP